MRLKFYMLCWLLMAAVQYGFCQGGTWIWVKGSDSTGAPANFGSLGEAGAANNPQGVYEGMNWIDNQGNFWVFGGVGVYNVSDSIFSYQNEIIVDSVYVNGVLDSTYDSLITIRVFDSIEVFGEFNVTNDLWTYNPNTNLWTWMGGPEGIAFVSGQYGQEGIPSPSNWPGARGWGSISWTDNNGNLWLFGGFGMDGFGSYSTLNDLWMYNIASGQWTWMAGSEQGYQPDNYGIFRQPSASNSPGGRQECSTAWVDGGNGLWFFGGMDEFTGPYNDVWKFDIGTNEWAWMNGPQGTYNHGYYGTFGVESSSNSCHHQGALTRAGRMLRALFTFGAESAFSPGKCL